MGRLAWITAGLALATPAAAQSIGGTYLVQGTGFDGAAYGGEAQIAATSDVTCRITWVTGGQTSEGICMRSGSVFAASYVLQGRIGMVIYEVRGDGSMQGVWTIDGMDATGTEALYPK